jgi:pyridoxine/pyridoxamine 5'-phosphate oxidase
LQAQEQSERQIEVAGTKVRVTSYKLGARFSCRVDNIDPGAIIGRASAGTREEAETMALDQATSVLSLRAASAALRSSVDHLKPLKR